MLQYYQHKGHTVIKYSNTVNIRAKIRANVVKIRAITVIKYGNMVSMRANMVNTMTNTFVKYDNNVIIYGNIVTLRPFWSTVIAV